MELHFRNQRLVQKMARECELYAKHPNTGEQVQSLLFVDVFTEEMVAFLETKRMMLTLIAATQVFVDINRIMRGAVTNAHQSLQLASRNMLPAATAYHRHPHSDLAGNREEDLPPSLRTLFATLKLLRTLDPVHRTAGNEQSEIQPTDWMATSFFRLHPWLCGHILFKLHYLSMDVILDPHAPSRVLVYALHLYSACKQYELDQGCDVMWREMERFAHLHGALNLFAGRGPDSPESRVKSLNLMRGASVTTPLPAHLLACATRSRIAIRQSRDGERHLKAQSYTLVFRNRHTHSMATPLDKSLELIAVMSRVVGDLGMTGTVSSSFFDRIGNRIFGGKPWPQLAEALGLSPVMYFALRHGKDRLNSVHLELIAKMTALRESELHAFPHLDLHARCLFDEFHAVKHPHDPALIAKWVLEDWWYSDAQRHGPGVESYNII
ncbi:hypothetical protein GGF32_003724 [Allomyces javanicus]|nr:hypothetical protein GGF32_003724 [Allomyces javanicus]